MTAIGETSSPRKDSEITGRGLVTLKEARELGIQWDREPPPPSRCRYCGSELHREGVVVGGRVVLWLPKPRRCSCKEAEAYWERCDLEESERRKAALEAERRRRANERIELLLGRSGLKKRFMTRTFENFVRDTPGREQSYEIAKEYADNFERRRESGDGLYIEGPNGTGKTHLAAAIALSLIGRGIPVVFRTAFDIFLELNAAMNGGKTAAGVLSAYRDADLLVIDDLGKERCTEWSASVLCALVNDRYEDLRPTVVTSNYTTEALERALTPKDGDSSAARAVVSRLKETCLRVTMAWNDARLGGGNLHEKS